MLWISLAFGVGFLTSLLLLPMTIKRFTALGIVDKPDLERKLHGRVVPVSGGVAVCAAIVAGSLFGLPVAGHLFHFALLVAAVLMTAMGFLDDTKGLRGRQKLVLQILIAAFVVFVGDIDVTKFSVFDHTVQLGVFGPLFAILWIVGTVNAVNLLDGADGMASIVGVVLGAALVAMCLALGKITEAAVPAALVGALLAFLKFNLPPARIFLGDAGSQLIGLVLGASALQASLKGPTGVALLAIVGIWSVPLFDASIAILRRRLTGRSMYYPDRGHLHHRLIDKGLSGTRLLAVVGVLCLVTASGAVVSVAAGSEWFALAGIAVTLGVLVFGRLFGHSEVRALAESSARFAFSMVRTRGQVRSEHGKEASVRLRGTHAREKDWLRLWDDLKTFARVQGLSDARLIVHIPRIDEDFSASWRSHERPAYERTWRSELPLLTSSGTVGRLEIAGPADGPADVASILRDLRSFERELRDLIDRETSTETVTTRSPGGTPIAVSHRAEVATQYESTAEGLNPVN